MFDRYAIETQIKENQVSSVYDTEKPIYTLYTVPDQYVPSRDLLIEQTAKSIVGKDTNPFSKARKLYKFLLDRLSYSAVPRSRDPIEILQTRVADAFGYTRLFCALARNVGIPSRPIAGYLVDQTGKAYRHYWAEFYLEDFGWVPVDLSLGDGARIGSTSPGITTDPAEYYFGNNDNQHITISRGIMQVKSMDPAGKVVKKDNMYSFQTIYEEVVGNIESYQSVWQDVQVIGFY